MAEAELRDNETSASACNNAEEESENADSYSFLTKAYQELVWLLITERFRAVDTVPGRQDTTFKEPKFLGHFDIEAGIEKGSSKENRSAKKANDSPRQCKKEDRGVDENEPKLHAAYSYLSEARQQVSNTHQEGRLLITGQFKFMDHRDTPEHHELEEPTGQQLDDDTFKEPNSLGYFYIEAGPIAHSQ